MNQVTTIKLQRNTKSELDSIKAESESYDAAIKKLISGMKNKNLKRELIEGYQSMGKKDLKLLEEWDSSSSEVYG